MPSVTDEKWKEAESGYRELWGFPNCVGSIDGKHVKIECPPNSGSNYFCYKSYFSIVLLAIVDPYYKFLIVDIGNYGRHSDSGIFENSVFYNNYIARREILPAKPLPGSTEPVPQVLIGDEGFALKPYLMRPFPKNSVVNDERKRRFNYRLCRARRVVENAFGILTEKWRVYHRPIECKVETAICIVQATCCLHNYVRIQDGHRQDTTATTAATTQPETTSQLEALAPLRRTNQRSSNLACNVREKFVSYFNNNQ